MDVDILFEKYGYPLGMTQIKTGIIGRKCQKNIMKNHGSVQWFVHVESQENFCLS